MVLTKAELIGLLENDVRVFLHLVGKLTPESRDYPLPQVVGAVDAEHDESVGGCRRRELEGRG